MIFDVWNFCAFSIFSLFNHISLTRSCPSTSCQALKIPKLHQQKQVQRFTLFPKLPCSGMLVLYMALGGRCWFLLLLAVGQFECCCWFKQRNKIYVAMQGLSLCSWCTSCMFLLFMPMEDHFRPMGAMHTLAKEQARRQARRKLLRSQQEWFLLLLAVGQFECCCWFKQKNKIYVAMQGLSLCSWCTSCMFLLFMPMEDHFRPMGAMHTLAKEQARWQARRKLLRSQQEWFLLLLAVWVSLSVVAGSNRKMKYTWPCKVYHCVHDAPPACFYFSCLWKTISDPWGPCTPWPRSRRDDRQEDSFWDPNRRAPRCGFCMKATGRFTIYKLD